MMDDNLRSFAREFESHLLAKPRRTNKEQQLLKKVLQAPDSRRRTRRLRHMEAHARVALVNHYEAKGITAAAGYTMMGYYAAIDWSQIDWAAIFKFLLELLIKLLPFILAIL